MDEVAPRIWLGSQESARDLETLKARNIKGVVVLGSEAFHPLESRLRYHVVQILDLPHEDLLGHLDGCLAFIEGILGGEGGEKHQQKDGRQKEEEPAAVREGPESAVLIHCVYGQSRGGAVAAAAVATRRNLSLQEAVVQIQKVRPTVHINPGFMSQLSLYELMGWTCQDTFTGVITRKQAFSTYRWFADTVKARKGEHQHQHQHCQQRHQMVEPSERRAYESGRDYVCRKCRGVLFNESDVILHTHELIDVLSSSTYAAYERYGDGSSWLQAAAAAASAEQGKGRQAQEEKQGGRTGKGQKGRAMKTKQRPRAANNAKAIGGSIPLNCASSTCTSLFVPLSVWVDNAAELRARTSAAAAGSEASNPLPSLSSTPKSSAQPLPPPCSAEASPGVATSSCLACCTALPSESGGKLDCPHCGAAKIGNWDMSTGGSSSSSSSSHSSQPQGASGLACSCGRLVKHAVRLTTAKVELCPRMASRAPPSASSSSSTYCTGGD